MRKLYSKLSSLKNKTIALFAFLYLVPGALLLAQEGTEPTGGPADSVNTIENPVGIESIDMLLTAILNFVVRLGTPVVTIAIIYAGFKFVAARGNSSKLEEARNYLWYVMIGAAIILGAFVLRTIISGTVVQLREGIQ